MTQNNNEFGKIVNNIERRLRTMERSAAGGGIIVTGTLNDTDLIQWDTDTGTWIPVPLSSLGTNEVFGAM